MSVWQFFIIFAANLNKTAIKARNLLEKKKTIQTKIKTIKI